MGRGCNGRSYKQAGDVIEVGQSREIVEKEMGIGDVIRGLQMIVLFPPKKIEKVESMYKYTM